MKKYVLILILVAVVAIFFGLATWRTGRLPKLPTSELPIQSQTSRVEQNQNNIAEPTPIPPFYDLTIPYLQGRGYESQLSELTEYQQFSTHTSYLTSYLSDQLAINGLLTIPAGTQPAEGWPAIVFLHGYIPPSEYQTTERYQDYFNYLARNGFVVFKIDLRGHGQSEGTASGAYFSGDYVIDTLNAHAALANADFVDAESIGLWGHSMAGNIVLRSMVAQPEIPAGVIWAGAVYTYEDMTQFGIQDSSYRRPADDSRQQTERNRLFETHDRSNLQTEFWQQVIPTNYLDSMTGALQLHHAVNDPVVSVEYSRNLGGLLNQAGVDHQVFEYSTGGHNLDGASFSQAMGRTVQFFEEKL